MKKYVLGVDGGSSKTHYAIFDSCGNAVGFARGGPVNPVHLIDGYKTVHEEFKSRIDALLSYHCLTMEDIESSVFGLSGADTAEQIGEFCQLIRSVGLRDFSVYNDAFLGIKAGSSMGYGICSINGSGTCCAAIDKKGRFLQIGGAGYCFGDEAGAGFMGELVVRRVYDWFYRCGKKTAMKEMLFSALGILDKNEIVEAIYNKAAPGTIEMSELSRIAFHAANQGDEAAIGILKYVGKETARSVAGAALELDFTDDKEILVIMAGSLYTKGENPTLVETFKDEVSRRLKRKIRFVLLKQPPVAGAVCWALEKLNGKPDTAIYDRVIEEFTNNLI